MWTFCMCVIWPLTSVFGIYDLFLPQYSRCIEYIFMNKPFLHCLHFTRMKKMHSEVIEDTIFLHSSSRLLRFEAMSRSRGVQDCCTSWACLCRCFLCRCLWKSVESSHSSFHKLKSDNSGWTTFICFVRVKSVLNLRSRCLTCVGFDWTANRAESQRLSAITSPLAEVFL